MDTNAKWQQNDVQRVRRHGLKLVDGTFDCLLIADVGVVEDVKTCVLEVLE